VSYLCRPKTHTHTGRGAIEFTALVLGSQPRRPAVSKGATHKLKRMGKPNKKRSILLCVRGEGVSSASRLSSVGHLHSGPPHQAKANKLQHLFCKMNGRLTIYMCGHNFGLPSWDWGLKTHTPHPQPTSRIPEMEGWGGLSLRPSAHNGQKLKTVTTTRRSDR